MVRLEEVQDEAFAQGQVGPAEDEADWDTDSESDISSISDGEAPVPDESFFDRVVALKDIIPPVQRRRIASTAQTGYSWGSWGVNGGLRLAWQFSTSILLLVVPFALASIEDQTIAMEEKQMQLQQSTNEIVAPGASSSAPGQQQPL